MIRGALSGLLLAVGAPAPAPVATPITTPIPAAAPAPTPVRLDRATVLVPGFIHPGRQPDGNSVVITGPTGVVVFDTGRHPAHTEAIARVVAATGKPLVAIVNSHWHLDHVSGNPALKAAHPGAMVYASDAIDGALTGFLKRSADGARAALARGTLPLETQEDIRADLASVEAGLRLRPDVVVGSTRTLTPGGRRITLNLAVKAATAGDVWLYDPAARRVLAGDLVTLPAPFLDTACPEGWAKALDRIAATPFRQLVPGHGPVMTRADFARYRTAFGRFLACAEGTALPGACARGWLADAGALIPPADTGRASAMATYYAGQVRTGALRGYCA